MRCLRRVSVLVFCDALLESVPLLKGVRVKFVPFTRAADVDSADCSVFRVRAMFGEVKGSENARLRHHTYGIAAVLPVMSRHPEGPWHQREKTSLSLLWSAARAS